MFVTSLKIPNVREFQGYLLARLGERGKAIPIPDELLQPSQKEPTQPYFIAMLYVGLDDKEKAFAWLAKAYDSHDFLLTHLKMDPIWDPLRSDPRFADLVHRVGFPHDLKRPRGVGSARRAL